MLLYGLCFSRPPRDQRSGHEGRQNSKEVESGPGHGGPHCAVAKNIAGGTQSSRICELLAANGKNQRGRSQPNSHFRSPPLSRRTIWHPRRWFATSTDFVATAILTTGFSRRTRSSALARRFSNLSCAQHCKVGLSQADRKWRVMPD